MVVFQFSEVLLLMLNFAVIDCHDLCQLCLVDRKCSSIDLVSEKQYDTQVKECKLKNYLKLLKLKLFKVYICCVSMCKTYNIKKQPHV